MGISVHTAETEIATTPYYIKATYLQNPGGWSASSGVDGLHM